MWTAYLNSLHESLCSRMIVVLFGLAMVIAILFLVFVHVKDMPDGSKVIFTGTQIRGLPNVAVPAVLVSEFQIAGGVWLFLTILGASPLLTAVVEKGWYELELSKGTPRWTVLFGRFLGGLTLYAATLMVATLPLALRLWWATGIPTWPLLVAILFQCLSFAALLSVAAIASLAQKGTILPNIVSVATLLLSPLLMRRQEAFYPFISSSGGRAILNGIYAALPKCEEIDSLCSAWISHGTIAWWPLWSTAIFTLVMLGLTLWLLERKSL